MLVGIQETYPLSRVLLFPTLLLPVRNLELIIIHNTFSGDQSSFPDTVITIKQT